MGKDPAVLFYTGDFLVGTMKMNYAQKGKYIQLLCLQHQDGHLSEDDMIEICGGYEEKIFSKFIKDSEGKYYNERMEVESIKRRKFVESRQNNFSKNHTETDMKTHTEPHMGTHMGKHTGFRMENGNINISIIEDIFIYWNSKNIIKHRELTEDISKAIEKNLKLYKEEEIKTYIDRYAKVIGDKNYFWHYKWSLKDFLSRKDGISSFTDEGSKWVSYCENTKNKEKPKYGAFDTDDSFERALNRTYGEGEGK